MGTHCRPLRATLRLAVGVLLLFLAACSSDGGNPGTRVLSGLVNVARFEVAPGERVQCTGDVTVQCQTAAIAGELYSADGRQAAGDAPDITIEATGDIVLSGRIVTGNGAGGAEQGGDGGSIRLASSTGSLTIGSAAGARGRAEQPVLQTGNGGNGADGLLGGAGGDGGVIRLEAPSGVLTIHQRLGLIKVGNGGHGGRGVVGGQDLLTFTPPAKQPNGGGDSGGIIATWGTVVGAEVKEDPQASPPKAIVLGEGVGTGGVGGDGGEFFLGVDPVSGTSTWPAARSAIGPARDVPALVEVVGSDGGNGAMEGGNGTSVAIGYADQPAPTGADGTDVVATGGTGGDANAIGDTFLFDTDMRGGAGGSARAVGGTGAQGNGCGANGGKGGTATATGGAGGGGGNWCIEVKFWFPGKGGDATARGGAGGTGGSCCNPPGQAGRGGQGGDADALGGEGGSAYPWDDTKQGAGGDAAALAGNGGRGGDGWSRGLGGRSGRATATAGWSKRQPGIVTDKRDGASGGEGAYCAPPPPQEVKVEVEPNDTMQTATPLGDLNKGSGSVDKVSGDPWDWFSKDLAAGQWLLTPTLISGDIGLVVVEANGTSYFGEGLSGSVPFDVLAAGTVLIQFTQPLADQNAYSFEIVSN